MIVQESWQITREGMPMKLSLKQSRFVDEYLIDLNGAQAAIRAGYSPRCAKEQASRLLTYAHVQAEIEERNKDIEIRLEISRENVLEGFQEAYELAKTNNNPGAMTGANRELGKMCGYYEPEKKQIEFSQTGEKQHLRYLESLSDEELMGMLGERGMSGDIDS